MDPDREAADIRRAMAEVRHDVNANAAEVATRARELADWRHYVRNYPKTSLAAAAALGYLVVPAIRMRPSRNAVKGIAKAVAVPETAAAGGAAQQVLGAVARLAIRNGLPLVTRELAKWWQQRQAAARPSSGRRPTSSWPDSPGAEA